MPGKKNSKHETVGRKIRLARTGKKIPLDRVANETGFSVDYLKDIEAGKKIPPVGALIQISKALEIDSGSLLKDTEINRKNRERAYTIRTESYAYRTLTPGAEHKHLKAFQINIEAHQDHKGVGYHHEGEEFVYVLKGEIEVTVGEHINRLKKGESLHFNSGIQHELRSISDETAELLVVIYTA